MANILLEQNIITDKTLLRKSQLTGLLELVCQRLELTETQFNLAKDRYEAVGAWLSEARMPLLQKALIYPHGSIALGTTTKPVHRNEYDVDLVCFLQATSSLNPAYVKGLVGDRLREHATYRPLLEEKKRCWRLNYANEFHLDITPAISNQACQQGGELVPDKQLQCWKESNPRGYKRWFDDQGRLLLRFKPETSERLRRMHAEVQPLPTPTAFKGVLRRCVQLSKRHRDMWFERRDDTYASISIIITTLAAKSYAYCATHHVYETEYDALMDVIRRMPLFMEVIQQPMENTRYCLWNPTTQRENFAERWNEDQRYASAFVEWHKALIEDFARILTLEGIDRIGEQFSLLFGPNITKRALNEFNERMVAAREDKKLSVLPRVGILSTAAVAGSVPVRANTFFGA